MVTILFDMRASIFLIEVAIPVFFSVGITLLISKISKIFIYIVFDFTHPCNSKPLIMYSRAWYVLSMELCALKIYMLKP